jgi:hypothetical protein
MSGAAQGLASSMALHGGHKNNVPHEILDVILHD